MQTLSECSQFEKEWRKEMMYTPDIIKSLKDRAFEIIISNLPAAGVLVVMAVMIIAAMVVAGQMP
jgi:hypothetical protein